MGERKRCINEDIGGATVREGEKKEGKLFVPIHCLLLSVSECGEGDIAT